MEALKGTALLYAKLEEGLRQATAAGKLVTVAELYARPDIQRAATKLQQVKDCVQTLRRHKCLFESPILDKERAKARGARIAYGWSEGAKFVLGASILKRRRNATKKPSPVVTTKFAKPNLDEVELVLNGVEIIAGVNPATGRIRIIIESKK
jgi:hypothetical protein